VSAYTLNNTEYEKTNHKMKPQLILENWNENCSILRIWTENQTKVIFTNCTPAYSEI